MVLLFISIMPYYAMMYAHHHGSWLVRHPYNYSILIYRYSSPNLFGSTRWFGYNAPIKQMHTFAHTMVAQFTAKYFMRLGLHYSPKYLVIVHTSNVCCSLYQRVSFMCAYSHSPCYKSAYFTRVQKFKTFVVYTFFADMYLCAHSSARLETGTQRVLYSFINSYTDKSTRPKQNTYGCKSIQLHNRLRQCAYG